VARYIEDLKKRGRSAAKSYLVKSALTELSRVHGDLPARSLGPLRLRAFRDHLEIARPGWSRRRINLAIANVVAAWSWGASFEIVPPEVIVGLKTVRPLSVGETSAHETTPVNLASMQDVTATLPYLTPGARALVEVCLQTGARPGELRTMTLGQIDRSGPIWIYQPLKHKTKHRGKTRVIPLNAKCQEIIRPLIKSADPNRHLFLSKTGEPYASTVSLANAIRRGCRAAGVPIWSVRQLRKNVAQKVDDAIGIQEASALLGHSGTEITKRVYAKETRDKAIRAAENLGKIS
jgi:integrase